MVAEKSNLCESCKATGMTFIPVQYAPVPVKVKPALPAWAHSEKVTKIDLGADYHYALRTMREGYFYLFYPKGMRGSNYWEAYTIYTDGSLARQATPKSAEAPKSAPECVKHGIDNTGLHYIVIQQPDKCDTVYIAYSEHKWSDDTLKLYATDTAKRDARMQTIKPSSMLNGAASSHGTLATKDSIEAVLDYNSSFVPEHLPDFSTPLRSYSQPDGSYDVRQLIKNSTMYPWSKRKGQADHLIKNMQKRSVKKDGSPAGIHVIAVWDAVGIVHELNGFMNEAAGRLKQYTDERDLEVSALNLINGLRVVLTNNAQGQVQDRLTAQKSQLNYAGAPSAVPASKMSSAMQNAIKGGYVNTHKGTQATGAQVDQDLIANNRKVSKVVSSDWTRYKSKLNSSAAYVTFK